MALASLARPAPDGTVDWIEYKQQRPSDDLAAMPDAARTLHVIFGTGPLGLAVMRALRAQGRRVRMINRSSRVRFDKDLKTEVGGGDAADPGFAREVCDGAAVVHHCIGLPYPRWRELPGIARGIVEGAAAAGATLVYADNLYAYGPVAGPMDEGLPETATTVKGRIRAEVAAFLLDAHRKGQVSVAIGRGSDFFGPHATDATMLGSRVFGRILAGKPAQAIGDPDHLHSYTYLDDFAHALVVLGARAEAAGQVWHVPNAPPMTTRAIVVMLGELAGRPARVSVAPGWMIGLAGLLSPQLRELKELIYEFDRDFVVDSTRFETAFGIRATPLHEALARTLDWFRSTGALPPT